MEKGIILLRESDENLLEGYGLEVQEEVARSWSGKREIEIVGVEAVVETARSWHRVKYEEILDRCVKRHHTEGITWVVLPRVDREARKQFVFWYYVGLLVREGLKVGFAQEDITTIDPPEKVFMLSLHAYKAEADGDALVKNLKDGKLKRAREGRFPSYAGDLWPYQYVRSLKKKGGAVREIIPEREQWCRQWLGWLREGVKGNEIARKMDESDEPPPRGNHWTRTSIFGILKNRALRGKTTWGGIPLPAATPPIFTEEEGYEIDNILVANRERASRNARQDYELSGHVLCECGAKVWGFFNNVNGHIYLRYRCYHCHRYVSKIWLEAMVKTKVMPVITNRSWLKTYLDSRSQGDGELIKKRLAYLDSEINRRLNVLSNRKRQHAWGDLTDEEYQRERDKIKADLERLGMEKTQAMNAYNTLVDAEKDFEVLERVADQIHEKLLNGDSNIIHRVYDTLNLRVVLFKDRVHISALVPLEEFDVAARASRYCFPPKAECN